MTVTVGAAALNLKMTISRTSKDDGDYLQIMSDDTVSVNIVLVANRIDVTDSRRKVTSSEPQPRKGKAS